MPRPNDVAAHLARLACDGQVFFPRSSLHETYEEQGVMDKAFRRSQLRCSGDTLDYVLRLGSRGDGSVWSRGIASGEHDTQLHFSVIPAANQALRSAIQRHATPGAVTRSDPRNVTFPTCTHKSARKYGTQGRGQLHRPFPN